MIAVDYLDCPHVSRAQMFGSEGLRSHGRFFAFVGADGALIVKLPAERAAGLVDDGTATPVRTGRHVTREWVNIPADYDAERHLWRDVIAQAYRHATQS